MPKAEAEEAIIAWRAAYRRRNQTDVAPPMLYKRGWLTVMDGTRCKYRLAKVLEMTERLHKQADQLGLEPPR